MKIAVLGGTFNPLHNGHVMLAETVCEKLGYDKVLFVPSFIPPHKIIMSGMTAEDRLEMVRGFCEKEGSGRFVCEDCEIKRGGVSYTVDTLAFITEKYRGLLEGKPAFILGEESAAEFHKWKNPEKIAELADLIIAHREEGKLSDVKTANTPSENYKGDFKVRFNPETFSFPYKKLENPVLVISSSEIRALVKSGDDWERLVPESVAEYIKKKNLYRE